MGTCLRVSIGKPEEMRTFLAAFREIVPATAKSAA
jgi:histidinol-phosphate/aromatic aminotransferase/cobyric acid decarboxylase-like protein